MAVWYEMGRDSTTRAGLGSSRVVTLPHRPQAVCRRRRFAVSATSVSRIEAETVWPRAERSMRGLGNTAGVITGPTGLIHIRQRGTGATASFRETAACLCKTTYAFIRPL
ncbi:hypothetical protein KPB2_5559 [Klebsiella pneumoniae Kb677]|nr:hypothetical protein KPB2_5559 [Klebsiella pneumoniae Kb677]